MNRIQGVWTVLMLLSAATCGAATREWADKTGKFHVQAELVTVKNGKVYLEKADGSVITVPLSKMSEKDLDHLQELPECERYFEENPLPEEESKPGQPPRPAIRLDDPEKAGEVRKLPDKGWGVRAMAFSPNGKFLAIGKMDSAILLVDVNKAKRLDAKERLEQLGGVTCTAFAPRGDRLLTGGDRGRIQIWNVSRKGELTEADRFVGHTGKIGFVQVSEDGKFAISGAADKAVRYWNIETCKEVFSLDGFSGRGNGAYLTKNGKQALAADNGTLALIGLAEQKVLQKMETVRGSSESLAIAPDGSRVALYSASAIRLFDIRTGRQSATIEVSGIQWCLAFTRNGKYLLAGSDKRVNLWDIDKKRQIYQFDMTGTGDAQVLAVSPDQWHFAAVSNGPMQSVQIFRLPAEAAQ